MSAGAFSCPTLPRDQELLGDLLHSLSQPLTSLRCSLELSVNDGTENQQQAVSVALHQTETVIEMIRLMREYLDPEPLAPNCTAALAPVLQRLAVDLSSIAAVRCTRLRVAGTSAATLPMAESQLRRALQYLILPMIIRVPPHGEIALLLNEERPLLRARTDHHPKAGTVNPPTRGDPVQGTINRVRVAIAVRMLESAGATLSFEKDSPGFELRIAAQPDRL